ncbi:glutamine amidotransferase [Pedobacter sp. PAMC26386]|nr:glutamine amidotransferase [Pedobacter sp. PAMC26386]
MTALKHVYIFLFDDYSDWEIAYLMPELFKSKKIRLKTFTVDGISIVSMGGLKITPDLSLQQVKSEEVSVLVLPGGTAWGEKRINGIDKLVEELNTTGKTIAAICDATIYLGEKGYLDDISHTSNDLDYLQSSAPDYKGGKNYKSALAVSDKNFITANGIAPIEFAVEIFRKIKLYSEADIQKWFQLFKNGIWTD